jgi:hypothetical protein
MLDRGELIEQLDRVIYLLVLFDLVDSETLSSYLAFYIFQPLEYNHQSLLFYHLN